jgi:hypothetical protein
MVSLKTTEGVYEMFLGVEADFTGRKRRRSGHRQARPALFLS